MGQERCRKCGRRFDRPSFYEPCCEFHPDPRVREKVVEAIEADLLERDGLRQAWESLPDADLDKIRDLWADIVQRVTEEWF